jgi:hypothetical protein
MNFHRIAAIFRVILIALACFVVPSGVSFAADGEPMMLPIDATALSITRDGASLARFDVEIADNPSDRSRGLMFREKFSDDRAMLFIFEETRPVAFWMENTPRPLDMLFVRPDGVISSIAEDTTPFSRAAVPSREPVLYVIEINAGLGRQLGLMPGDTAVHPAISGEAR